MRVTFLFVILLAATITGATAWAADAVPDTGLDRLMPFNAAGKWGFVAKDVTKGEFTLPPTYELAYPFRHGRAAVRENKKWGFIDEKGIVVIAYQFDEIQKGIFRSGVAIVKKAGLYGVIDRDGKIVLPIQFKSISLDDKEGRLTATIPNPADPNDFMGLSGLYDLTGKQIMPPEYSSIHAFFKNGVTVVEKGGKRALASSAGQLLTPLQYDQTYHVDISHFICVKDKGLTHDLYDEHGKLLFTANAPYVGSVVDQRAVFKNATTKRNGYLDEKGQVVIPAQFVLAGTFSEGLAVVQRATGGVVEVIDTTGASTGTILNAFIRLDKFKNGYVWLADKTDKKVYLYDKSLKKVFAQGFYYATDFDANGLSRAQAAPKQNGLINLKGEWVVQPEWTNIEVSSIPGQYIVSKDRERGIVNATGQILFKPQALSIEKWDDQFVKIAPSGFSMTGDYHCFWRKDGIYLYSEK